MTLLAVARSENSQIFWVTFLPFPERPPSCLPIPPPFLPFRSSYITRTLAKPQKGQGQTSSLNQFSVRTPWGKTILLIFERTPLGLTLFHLPIFERTPLVLSPAEEQQEDSNQQTRETRQPSDVLISEVSPKRLIPTPDKETTVKPKGLPTYGKPRKGQTTPPGKEDCVLTGNLNKKSPSPPLGLLLVPID